MVLFNMRQVPAPGGGGRGLVTTCAVKAGELLWVEDPDEVQGFPRSMAYINALPADAKLAFTHFMCQVGEDMFESLPEFDTLPFDRWHEVAPTDPASCMNHSCDPTCWYVCTDTQFGMTARRDLAEGEAVTFDYATCLATLDEGVTCLCGTALCRGVVKEDDWTNPELQRRYAGHWMPFLQRRIDIMNGVKTEPLPFRGHATSMVGPAGQPKKWRGHPLARHVFASGDKALEAYDRVNELIVANKLAIKRAGDMGHSIVTAAGVDPGSVVMVLPPFFLARIGEAKSSRFPAGLDFNAAVAVQQSPTGDPDDTLMSFALTRNDIDCFLAHSCDPNCELVLGSDYTIQVVAKRAIPSGGVLTFDYEKHEADIESQGVAFDCACGSASCRGRIVGYAIREQRKAAAVQRTRVLAFATVGVVAVAAAMFFGRTSVRALLSSRGAGAGAISHTRLNSK